MRTVLAHDPPQRAGGRKFVRCRVRRVATRRKSRELPGACEPDDQERHHDERYVADGAQVREKQRRVPAEAEPFGEDGEEERRPGETGDENAEPDRHAPVSHLRKPEPDVERGQEEHEREGIGRDDEQRERAETEQRSGVAGELLLRRDRAPGDQALARDEPAGSAKAPRASNAFAGQSCATGLVR